MTIKFSNNVKKIFEKFSFENNTENLVIETMRLT